MKMRNLLFLMFLVMSVSVIAESQEQYHEPLKLKNGSYLFINEDETMRMVDRHGMPVQMKDGVEMELEDGTVIMMKNKKIWRHDHRDMKR
jgi:hypothetical protein